MEKVLIELAGGLGDELCFIPAYKALKKKYHNNIELHVKSRFREILLGNPYVDATLRYNREIDRSKYWKNYIVHWHMVPHGTGRYSHLKTMCMSLVGLTEKDWDGEIYYNILEEDLVKPESVHLPDDKIKICFDTYASAGQSRVEEKKYRRAMLLFQEKHPNTEIYQIGKNSNFMGAGHNLIGQFNVRELAAFISKCDLYVGNNSGAFHLASVVGTQICAFFTVTAPSFYIHNEDKTHIYQADIKCKGCLNNMPNYNPVNKRGVRCPEEQLLCKKLIEPIMMVGEMEKALGMEG